MERRNPPFQIISIGKTFRYEATDATHETNFHQVEGLMIGKDVSLANFKFVISEFFRQFFSEKTVEVRFRSSYFPFVEPGVEVDVKLDNSRWLEMGGAGMVHPNVLKSVKYNPKDWQGFAFGFGVERLAIIKHKIPDIRLFESQDLKFTRKF
jgi:phenylalanyl-tRNA synthetase alpha chain